MNYNPNYNFNHPYIATHIPAKDGAPRRGVIVKELVFRCDYTNDSHIGVVIDTDRATIAVYLLGGTSPKADRLFWALLADRDVRRVVEAYLESSAAKRRIFKMEVRRHGHGSVDYFLHEAVVPDCGIFMEASRRHLCHVSCAGKLNDDIPTITVAEFVELVAAMGLTNDLGVASLRKKANVKYVKPRTVKELEEYGWQQGATQLFPVGNPHCEDRRRLRLNGDRRPPRRVIE